MGVGGQRLAAAVLLPPFLPGEGAPVPTAQGAACAPGPVWTGVEKRENHV